MSSDKPTGGSDYVRVVVMPPIPGTDFLTYEVPPFLTGQLEPGMRVLVPLGNRQVTGIVLEPESSPPSRVKRVLDRLDESPLLPRELLELCAFASSYYQCSLGEVFSTVVLAGLKVESHRVVRLAAPVATGSMPRGRSSLRRTILERLGDGRTLRTQALARGLSSSGFYEALRTLAGEGVISIVEEAPKARATVRQQRFARLDRAIEKNERERIRRRAPSQYALLEKLSAEASGISVSSLGDRAGALRALIRAGYAKIELREVYRAAVAFGDLRSEPERIPNEAQSAAIEAIDRAAVTGRFEVALLHGVTGSGKTEVYLRAAARVLDRGRSVLFLVPEIALTHDAVARVCSRFGERVAVLHSGLGAGERFDEWRRLARREARIVVGVRSAVFAPLPDLGLVIVDEEHDGAYKQEDGLRYNARDLAIVRARNAECPVVVGSATPSMESHRNASTGRFTRLSLPERIERRPLPSVELIDLRAEPPVGEPAIFAPRLLEALERNVAAGEQSLLFLNRRGFAHYLQCRLCGGVIECPRCSVTLTYHRRARALRCHHCDHAEPTREICPHCTRPGLSDFGVGTEQLEDALTRKFPQARIARLDRDAMRGKGALQKRLRDWREGRIDILVGTQMIAKGHDVPGVTFVGVIAADSSLNLPDFRAAERTFQLLTQVAGRTGRGDRPGRVWIQTYRPDHYAIFHACSHDFEGFAAAELENRAALAYPPFRRLALVRLDGEAADRVQAAAHEFAEEVRRRAPANGVLILGPAPAPLERLRNRWRWQVLAKAQDARLLHDSLQPTLRLLGPAARRRGIRIGIDVDPYGML